MAANGEMKAHERTYTGFLGWLKWGTIVTAILVAIVVLIIAG